MYIRPVAGISAAITPHVSLTSRYCGVDGPQIPGMQGFLSLPGSPPVN